MEKGGALYLNKLEFPSPKDALCQVWLKLGPVLLEKNFFKFYQCNIAISLLSRLILYYNICLKKKITVEKSLLRK